MWSSSLVQAHIKAHTMILGLVVSPHSKLMVGKREVKKYRAERMRNKNY